MAAAVIHFEGDRNARLANGYAVREVPPTRSANPAPVRVVMQPQAPKEVVVAQSSLLRAAMEDLPPELAAELAASEQQLLELRKQRASRVAELTRLSEALADGRARRAMAEAEADELGRAHQLRVTRRAEVQRRLEEKPAQVETLRQRCVAAQATPPEPKNLGQVAPEVQPLVDRAAALDEEVKSFSHRTQQRKDRNRQLEEACKAEINATAVMERSVAIMEEVYQRADQVMDDLDKESNGFGDPEQTVLALAKAALPLARFSDAADAIAHMRSMSKVFGPQLMPASPQLMPAPGNSIANVAAVAPQRAPLLPSHPPAASLQPGRPPLPCSRRI